MGLTVKWRQVLCRQAYEISDLKESLSQMTSWSESSQEGRRIPNYQWNTIVTVQIDMLDRPERQLIIIFSRHHIPFSAHIGSAVYDLVIALDFSKAESSALAFCSVSNHSV